MVRVGGYLKTLTTSPCLAARAGVPVRLGDVRAPDRPGDAAWHRRTRRRGRRSPAAWWSCARARTPHETIAAVKAKSPSCRAACRGRRDRDHHDRSALIERAVRQPGDQAGRGVHRRRPVCAVFLWHLRSALVAIIVTLAAGRTGGVRRQKHYQGHQRQHHVAGRHRDRDRRDGRRRDRDDRERAQKIELGSTPSGATRSQATRALGRDDAGCGRGRPGALLLAARDHALVRPGVHAAGAGGRLFSRSPATKTWAMAGVRRCR